MSIYTLTVNMANLVLTPTQNCRVVVYKRRNTVSDAFPPTEVLYKTQVLTNSSGIATLGVTPDDETTYQTCQIFDLNGVEIYYKRFSMGSADANIEDTDSSFANTSLQIKVNDSAIGTPSTVDTLNFIGGITPLLSAGQIDLTFSVGATGFVAITDITPTSTGNVGTKVRTDDDYVLQSCISSTTDVTVSVLAVTGPSGFKPTVTVNGIAATLTRNANTDVWVGSAAITLTGTSPYTVTAVHGDGATDSATVTEEIPPEITGLTFSGAYPAVGQTEHAQGQTLSLNIVSDVDFIELEVIDDSGTATEYLNSTFAATTSKTVTVTVADRGSYGTGAPAILPAKARIRSVNGTWGDYFESSDFGGTNGVNILALNNTRPVVTIGTITYPVSQYALKNSETATVSATYANVDSVNWTSPNSQLSVTDPTVADNKTVTRIAGGYNISTNNLQAVSQRVANATTATASAVVWIAHDTPTINITTPAARLRSGVSAQNHTITMTASQRVNTVSLSASVGTFTGSWSTSDNGVSYTRTLQIADSDTKGAATFSSLSVTNLAGRVVTTIGSGDSYTVGGFIQRTVSVAAWPNREADIGTLVADTSKLRATNLSKGESGSLNTAFVASVGDAVNTYTITSPTGVYNANGNLLYNRDLPNAVSNTTGTMQFEIEEIV